MQNVEIELDNSEMEIIRLAVRHDLNLLRIEIDELQESYLNAFRIEIDELQESFPLHRDDDGPIDDWTKAFDNHYAKIKSMVTRYRVALDLMDKLDSLPQTNTTATLTVPYFYRG